MSKRFHERHKPHLTLWAISLVVMLVSGYFAFYPRPKPEIVPPPPTETTTTTVNIVVAPKKIEPEKVAPTKPVTSTENKITSSTTVATGLPVSLQVGGKNLETTIPDHSNVYDLMQKLRASGELDFIAREFGGLGYFIEELNGVKSDTANGRYWIYYINGTKAQIGISNYILKSNDVISWKYENDVEG